MSTKIKYTLWIVLVVVLLALIFLVVATNKKTTKLFGFNGNKTEESTENLTPEQKAVKELLDKQAAQDPSKPKVEIPSADALKAPVVNAPAPTAMPVYTKDVNLVWMTDAEKKELGLSADMRVQVLVKNANGKITDYKIIRQDSDIMKKYGN
jgi:ABC-type Na+ efflux pump permease subunit